ncbi:hypothetical protein TRFO_10502 [Tritrichomonas foetus]|uniref:Uncharacterized protein n=1 Tax=Tritrichomonas foetus TaxID=1144522 RepID=A0A1J4JD73_9EUKA|nr:hypothetical protein TRFO_10502 [Tritrichomonas foetus]|eukprot:OHS95373.1 hypothetical protein TRFO_10502 [Tritrichomonas foetus]
MTLLYLVTSHYRTPYIYDNFSIIDGFRFIALEQSQRFLFGNIHIETVHKKLGKHSMSITELPALIVSDNYHKKFLIQSNIIADSFFSAFLNDVARRKHDNKMFQHLEVFLNDQDSSASAIVLTLAICSFVLLSLLLLMGFAISGADFKFDTLMKKEINSDTCLTLYRENAEQVDETDPSDI